MDKAKTYTHLFELNTKKKISQLSTGYHSIFKLIIALSLDIPYILLDEPVLGLDANHRELFYQCLLESYAENPRTFVISTHLIEEISNLVEEVIIIKNGSIIKNCSCESLLSSYYAVSGKASDVDSFLADKNVVRVDTLGGLKTAYLLGDKNSTEIPTSLEVSVVDLQKLFIQLTN